MIKPEFNYRQRKKILENWKDAYLGFFVQMVSFHFGWNIQGTTMRGISIVNVIKLMTLDTFIKGYEVEVFIQ